MTRVIGIILLSFSISAVAQIKYTGIPGIRNFPKSVYNAGTQNWAISQDSNGFIYFANNDGLLRFDGVEWNLTPVSSSSPLRSILVDSEGSIYAGLINDFGIITMEDDRDASFMSLKNLLPDEYREFDDVWRIHQIDDAIVFQCYKYIFIYHEERVEVITPENLFRFSFMLGDRLIIQEPGIGLFELRDGKLVNLSWWQRYNDLEISAVLETEGGDTLICTTYNGIFILDDGQIREWDTPVNSYALANRLYSATVLPGGYLALGTILNGLVICDKIGNIVHTLNSDNGIQNNTILTLFQDRSGNLWLGLDNGIDYLETNSPLSYIGSAGIGTGYCCRVYKGNLYLGTNQGLYVTGFNNGSLGSDFELVENTAGQVWTLDEFDGQLLCGHNQGTFIVEGKSARKICSEEGAWKYIAPENHPEKLVAGHYQGLVLLKKSGGEWRFDKRLEGFKESSRYLFQDREGYLWIGHGGRGIFRIALDLNEGLIEEVAQYSRNEGLPSDVGNILFQFDGYIFVAADSGIYQYNSGSDLFEVSDRMNELFRDAGKIKTVSKDSEGIIWFIGDSGTGFIRRNEDMAYTRITVPFKKINERYVNEFEFIYPFDRDNIFIGLEDGFAHYSPRIPKDYNREYKAFITRVDLPYIDSILFFRSAEINSGYEFPFRKNSFRFHFAAPFPENGTPLEFSYFLEGLSDEWSQWSVDNYKDFTTLHEGSYVLKLKSRNIYGAESETASFQFEISPPWQRSVMAYIVYLALVIAVAFAVYIYVKRRVRLSAQRQEERHQHDIREREDRFQREALIAEKEIIKLRNDKLMSEMAFRNRELANQTLGIINKNKFLSRINEDLGNIQDFVVNDSARAKIHSLKKRIAKEIDIKHQNKIFESYFDEANEEFFKRLKERHPDLTAYDLRLCAYIRMDISTKEIASMLNISYRGAEVSRYRLRKKMDLPREVNLSSYLVSL